MKRPLFFTALLTVFALLFAASAARAEFLKVEEGKFQRYLTVEANAEVRVKPDRLNVTFGIQDRSKNLHAAKERMNRIVKEALAFCKAHGVPEKNIQTTNISIAPEYGYDDTDRIVLRYYELSQSLVLTLEDLGKYDEIVFGLLDKGINVVGNVSFSTTELRKYRDQARLAAIKAAQEKAKLLTDAVGISLGKAVDIRESSVYYPWLNQGANFSQNVAQSRSADEEGESVAAGMVSVRASVSITYELGNP